MFSKLLVPVDLAEPDVAQPAIHAAVKLAGDHGGALRFVNVQSVVPLAFTEYVPADFDTQQGKRAEAELAEIASKCGLSADRVSSVVRFGGVYPEILAEADACKADLIVVGSHRPAMSTYLLGSNATTIVRHAECSVLVVR